MRSYRDLHDAVAPRVTARYPTQHPQIEGRVDAEVLGVTTLPRIDYVRVTGPTTDGASSRHASSAQSTKAS